MSSPTFGIVEYHSKAPENQAILRRCRCSWTRNKDIAAAAGLTPAGAKRRNGFLESVGLLERRRRAKEVQYCTTLLAYIANTNLVAEEPLAALGAVRSYLELTKEYSIRLLQDLQSLKNPTRGESTRLGGVRTSELVQIFLELREVAATVGYMWPVQTVSGLWIDLEGYSRPGAYLLEVNRMTIPLPVLTDPQFNSIAREAETSARPGTKRDERLVVWKEIARQILTGRVQVADYSRLSDLLVDDTQTEGKRGLHYAVIKRFNAILDGMTTKGPLLAPMKLILDTVLEQASALGLPETPIPDEVPVGTPRFPILNEFSQERYTEIRKAYTRG